eukprot:468381_1
MQSNKKRRANTSIKQPPKKKQKTGKHKNKKKSNNKSLSAWQSSQHCISWFLFNKQNISIDTFFKEYFGIQPLLIKRNNINYYTQQQLKFELKDVYETIKSNELKFEQHMICKSYNGNTEQQPSWIKPNDTITVSKFKKIINKGYTIQFHHPQHFYKNIAKMISLLESYFGVEVGCNVYITPNKKQGLAPHWDDVEVFVLQIEGKKHWKLYERTNDNNKYPLQSSESLNLSNDCKDAKFIMECDLNPGDLLYLPRGIIHCAKTVGKSHSTHITISTHQRATWGDFIQILMEQTINEAVNDNIELRQNMPLNFLSYMGSTFEYNDKQNMKEKQKLFVDKLQNILNNTITNCIGDSIHNTCDIIGADFVSNRLPPMFMLNQNENINVENNINVNENMKVCLKSIDWIRIVDDNKMNDESDNELNEDSDNESDDMYNNNDKEVSVEVVDMKKNEKDKDDNMDALLFVNDSDEEDSDNDIEQDVINEDNGDFRLYSCVNNDISTHCVEFKDEPKRNDGFIRLPMNLRPVIDMLINEFPKKIVIKELFNKCSEECVIELDEVNEFIKLLYDMQLIKLTT